MIEAFSLSKSFSLKSPARRVRAVDDVSFSARDGCVTGLLGANGAGKSTTLRMVCGLLRPDMGEVKLDTIKVSGNEPAIKQTIGYMPHNSGLYPRSNAIENITYFATLSGLKKSQVKERVNWLVDLLGMQDFCERPTEGFSQGQKTRVALARALVHQPKNIILDEPTNGLDVLATRSLRKILCQLRDEGHCVLISSHIMQEITLLCDYVAILNQGRIVIENSVEGILSETCCTDFEDAFVSLIQAESGDHLR